MQTISPLNQTQKIRNTPLTVKKYAFQKEKIRSSCLTPTYFPVSYFEFHTQSIITL